MTMVTVESVVLTAEKSMYVSTISYILSCIVPLTIPGCCPATNGQEAIEQCALAGPGEDCPSDKPQELTAVSTTIDYVPEIMTYRQRFCCPEKPVSVVLFLLSIFLNTLFESVMDSSLFGFLILTKIGLQSYRMWMAW